jgi:hypothetical protein
MSRGGRRPRGSEAFISLDDLLSCWFKRVRALEHVHDSVKQTSGNCTDLLIAKALTEAEKQAKHDGKTMAQRRREALKVTLEAALEGHQLPPSSSRRVWRRCERATPH